MKILVLNGPNLNMLGIRETNIYGQQSYQDLEKLIKEYCQKKHIEVTIKQSNHEGTLVDYIQEAYFQKYTGIVINPAAYTHTSVALLDAVKAIAPLPVVEVHLSDINQRDAFRKHSFLQTVAVKQIVGKGFVGYLEAIDYLVSRSNV